MTLIQHADIPDVFDNTYCLLFLTRQRFGGYIQRSPIIIPLILINSPSESPSSSSILNPNPPPFLYYNDCLIAKLKFYSSAVQDAHNSWHNGGTIEDPPLNSSIPYCPDVRPVFVQRLFVQGIFVQSYQVRLGRNGIGRKVGLPCPEVRRNSGDGLMLPRDTSLSVGCAPDLCNNCNPAYCDSVLPGC